MYEVDKSSGGTVTRTVSYYPLGGAMRINISGGSNTLYYLLKDQLGSASVVTDASGTIVGEDRFYPYGETRFTTGTMYTDQLFTGQREMTGLGIYHYGARFYSPKLGRFLSPDTIVQSYANPQTLNRYSYVLGNPLRYTDPTGHMVACGVYAEDCEHDDSGTSSGNNNDPNDEEDESNDDGGGGGKPLLKPAQNSSSTTLCPSSYSYCYEATLTYAQISDLEARLANWNAYLNGLITLAGSIAIVAELVAAFMAEGTPPALVAHGVAIAAAAVAATASWESSQMGDLISYIGEAKNFAENNGQVKIALFNTPGPSVPSLVYEGDHDGYAYGFSTLTGFGIVLDTVR